MALVINCECGTVVRGVTDDELVENAITHARVAHGMRITAEQALALAQRQPKGVDATKPPGSEGGFVSIGEV